MIRALTLIAILTLAAAPAWAQGPRADERALSVETLLLGFELVPSPEDWARVGDPAVVSAELMRIADDATRGVVQTRAMSSLAHFPTPEVEGFLAQRAGDGALDPNLRGKAVIAWAYLARDRVAPAVARLLAHPDERLREDAVRALRLMAAPEVESFLRARVALEPTPHVRGAIEAAAERVRGNREALVRDERPVPSALMPTDVPRVVVTP